MNTARRRSSLVMISVVSCVVGLSVAGSMARAENRALMPSATTAVSPTPRPTVPVEGSGSEKQRRPVTDPAARAADENRKAEIKAIDEKIAALRDQFKAQADPLQAQVKALRDKLDADLKPLEEQKKALVEQGESPDLIALNEEESRQLAALADREKTEIEKLKQRFDDERRQIKDDFQKRRRELGKKQ